MFYKLEPQKFYLLEIFFLFVHAGAIICAYHTNLVLLAKMAIISLVFIHYCFINHFKNSIAIWRNNAGDWYVNLSNQQIISVYLDSPIFISKHLVVLNFISKKDFTKISIPITKYALNNSNDFRRLKSIIKIKDLFKV